MTPLTEAERQQVEEWYPLAMWSAELNAKKYAYFFHQNDIESWAMEGLIIAVQTYNGKLNTRIKTWIIQKINWHIIDQIRLFSGRNGHLEQLNRASSLFKVLSNNSKKTLLLLDSQEAKPIKGYVDLDFWRGICQGLSKKERIVLLLYYIEKMQMREIGTHIGLSESRVSQMHTGLVKKLYERAEGQRANCA